MGTFDPWPVEMASEPARLYPRMTEWAQPKEDGLISRVQRRIAYCRESPGSVGQYHSRPIDIMVCDPTTLALPSFAQVSPKKYDTIAFDGRHAQGYVNCPVSCMGRPRPGEGTKLAEGVLDVKVKIPL